MRVRPAIGVRRRDQSGRVKMTNSGTRPAASLIGGVPRRLKAWTRHHARAPATRECACECGTKARMFERHVCVGDRAVGPTIGQMLANGSPCRCAVDRARSRRILNGKSPSGTREPPRSLVKSEGRERHADRPRQDDVMDRIVNKRVSLELHQVARTAASKRSKELPS